MNKGHISPGSARYLIARQLERLVLPGNDPAAPHMLSWALPGPRTLSPNFNASICDTHWVRASSR